MSQAPGVTVGNAAKVASEVTALALQTGVTVDNILPLYTEALDEILAAMAARTADAAPMSPTPPVPAQQGPQAQQRIEQAFPGTTVIEPAQQRHPGGNIVPPAAAPQQAAPSPAGPAPVPGVNNADAQLEEAWNVFFGDINAGTFADNWEDNRQLKTQGGKFAKIPDFKHKSWQRPGEKYPVGLYIDDKKNPGWVAQQLANVGIQS